MEQFLQLFFLLLIFFSAFMVVSSQNPVDSVLFLILVFLNSSGLLFLFEAEFIALIFIIIYVGAIAVLFLFIVMMLEIKVQKGSSNMLQYVPFALLLGGFFFLEIFFSLKDVFAEAPIRSYSQSWLLIVDTLSNLEMLGQVLYTNYIICFLISGILLLIAMLGAILLTLNFSSNRKNALISKQVSRSSDILVYFKNLS